MPVYDYHCKACGHDFVIIESLEEHEAHEARAGREQKCPDCGSSDVERVITAVHLQVPKKS